MVMTSLLAMTIDQFSGHDIYWTGHDSHGKSSNAIFKTLKITQINLMTSFMTRKLVIGHDESTGHDHPGHRLDVSQNLLFFRCEKKSWTESRKVELHVIIKLVLI